MVQAGKEREIRTQAAAENASGVPLYSSYVIKRILLKIPGNPQIISVYFYNRV